METELGTQNDLWTPFYWNDYVGDTLHLSLKQHGAYILLLAHYYRRGPLDANACVLHQVCRCKTSDDESAVTFVLKEFFALDGDVYRHKRADEELKKREEKSAVRRTSAGLRWQKDGQKCDEQDDANALQMHPIQDANALQLHTHTHTHTEEIITPPKTPRARLLPKDFEPNDNNRALAKKLGLDLKESLQAFKDYHNSKGTRHINWNLALNYWLRNERLFSRGGPPKAQTAPTFDALQAFREQK